MKTIFITGGTGYIGSRLIKRLLKKEYTVVALTRKGSEHKLPVGCEIVFGNALDATTYQRHVPLNCIFVHLVGVAHPSPSKKEKFNSIDLVSVREAVKAAQKAECHHFTYISVSQFPSRIMHDYQSVRKTAESYIRKALTTEGVRSATFIRPWYVLGPSHYWPLLLFPFYWLAKISKKYRTAAEAKDLVWIHNMLDTLEFAIETPPQYGERIFEIKDIKHLSKIKSVNNTFSVDYA